MTFWSGERLLEELPSLVEPFSAGQVDCASYRLSIGREVYISPTDKTSNAQERTVRTLNIGESFAIPSGQFAFLLTDETVTVPAAALALISMRAGTKFRGLVNVSGFHVDPGYHGKLLFAVFNAGPAAVHLKQGDPCFLIWYADLDRPSEKIKQGLQLGAFPVDRINPIAGEVHSFEALSKRLTTLEREGYFLKTVGGILLGLGITYLVTLIKDCQHDGSKETPAPVQIFLPGSATPAHDVKPPPQPPPTPSGSAKGAVSP